MLELTPAFSATQDADYMSLKNEDIVPLTKTAIEKLIAAVFAQPEALVLESYSRPGREALLFRTEDELNNYVDGRLSETRGYASLFVVYPDMKGVVLKERIELNVVDATEPHFRYTWNGWGMISVQLFGGESRMKSHVSANSATRASTWALTHPEWGSPDCWDWNAVDSHVRRLRRILNKFS